MKHDEDFRRKVILLSLALLAACASITASASARERRHVGVEEVSSHLASKIRGPESHSPKSSTSKNNEITAEPGKKVSHRLIGGHLRVNGKHEEESLWDDGILMSAAGNGKETKNNRGDEDDDKKTLSQQVKEGKYGLIQNEIYGERPKRPGIISYLGNPEVPKDTIDNLGGLDEEEIWLAENHVLVLRGGKFPGHETPQNEASQTWPPIDDYKAPRRPVKIPKRPKIPPPFPVQLTEGGPIQIFGPNGTKEIDNDTLDYENPLFSKGILPGEGPFFSLTPNGTLVPPEFARTKDVNSLNKSISPGVDGKRPKEPLPLGGPPFYHGLPPGAVIVPPPSNQTDYDDEDQSIYYPPSYSFHYQQDNTTAVPPGPLVPGIILPPPPDFFSSVDEKKPSTKKYTKRPGTTPLPRSRPTYLPPRKLTTKHYKTSTNAPTTLKTTAPLSITSKPYSRVTYKNATRTLNKERTKPYVEVTTVTPMKPTTLENTEFYDVSPVGNRVSETTTEEKPRSWSGLVNRKTSVPVLTYFATTTASSLERPVEVTPATIKNIVTNQPGRLPNQASYYFYEEPTEGAITTSSNPPISYRTTTESPYYKIETQPVQEKPKKQYYKVETVSPHENSKDYNVKLIDSLVKNPQVYRYSESTVSSTSSKFENTEARTQNQRMLSDRPSVYYSAVPERSSLAIQSYFTTPKPQTYYRETDQINQYGFSRSGTKPKPIYQYSFEAADYSKRGGTQLPYYKQEQQQQVSYEYQEIKPNSQPYDYEDAQQRLQSDNVPYKNQQPIFSTTNRGIIETTPNPQHTYFTQQEERLLDDVTKEYFTIFGKKLTGKGVSSTTPIYGKTSSVTERPSYDVNTYVPNDYNVQTGVLKTPNVKVHYGDQTHRPYSLKDDTLVNYKDPLPPINPDAEFITVVDPKHRQSSPESLNKYRLQPEDFGTLQNRGNQRLAPIRDYTSQRIVQQPNRPPNNFVTLNEPRGDVQAFSTQPISLEDDIAVNYRDPRPPINPDAEFIDPIPGTDNRPDKANAYFAYRLPGDSGHFYFLTPQAVTQRQDQNGAYLYPKPRGSRLLRRRRGPGNI